MTPIQHRPAELHWRALVAAEAMTNMQRRALPRIRRVLAAARAALYLPEVRTGGRARASATVGRIGAWRS